MVRGECHRPALCDPHSAHTAPERNASRRYFRARKWPNFSVERTRYYKADLRPILMVLDNENEKFCFDSFSRVHSARRLTVPLYENHFSS
jgi:hypothetical protein